MFDTVLAPVSLTGSGRYFVRLAESHEIARGKKVDAMELIPKPSPGLQVVNFHYHLVLPFELPDARGSSSGMIEKFTRLSIWSKCGWGSKCFGCVTFGFFPFGMCAAYFNSTSKIKRSRLAMDELKSKQRAVGILLVFASILMLIAAWDLPGGNPQSH